MTELVVLTTHFGTNFSGGSTATCRIFERLQDQFEKISVVGTQLGNHSFHSLEFTPYQNQRDAATILKSFNPDNTVFYGDFYNAVYFTRCNLPFYFTYHDNWPELGTLSFKFWLQKQYYWPAYQTIFNHARHVITVSRLKLQQVSQFTSDVSMVRNGVVQTPGNNAANSCDLIQRKSDARRNVLMVGNIDRRKYAKAIPLFKAISNQSLKPDTGKPEFNIDIYGHCNDAQLRNELERFSFVSIKSFAEYVPYHHYQVLLHTSLMENLSIVWCEAIMHRTPVLTFDVGAATEVVHSDRGYCIRPYDLDAMLDKLTAMLSRSDSTQKPNRPDNLSAFKSEFNWDNAARRYKELMFSS